MQAGQPFKCPYCKGDSLLKTKRERSGFTVVREYLACAFCGAEIKDSAAAAQDPTPKPAAKPSALDGLLGTHSAKPSGLDSLFGPEDIPRHFCRTCAFHAFNAFACRCEKHEKDVEPLDDCPDFEPMTSSTPPSL